MRYFPAFVDVAKAPVVVVGDGEKALQKLRLLAKTEAQITVIATSPEEDLAAFVAKIGGVLVKADFAPEQLPGARLVFAASESAQVDMAVADAARQLAIPVNVVDRPAESTFIVPALVDRDPIMVAIGTEGTAPILGREIKSLVERSIPVRLGEVARRAAGLRDTIAEAVGDPVIRRRVWERLLRGAWRQHVLAGRREAAQDELAEALAGSRHGEIAKGRVSLVGCGPGDPDLLTLKAVQRMQTADVLVVDGLVTEDILEYARRDARRIDVGKKGYGIATDQDAINRILITEAARGNNVVRLKGGDPFIFGRAAEEMTAVRAAGFEVDVVPGITAAHACAASIGLPVTLREKVRQFSVVTGATASGLPQLDWPLLARPGHASSVYMGVRTAPEFRQRLIDAGARRDMRVIIVENGTRANERVVATTLDLLAEAIEEMGVVGPAVIFLGLDWSMAQLSQPRSVQDYSGLRAADVATSRQPHAALAGNAVASLTAPVTGTRETGSEASREWTPEEIAMATMWVAG